MTVVEAAMGGAPTLVTDWPLMVGPLKGPLSTGTETSGRSREAGAVEFGDQFILVTGETLARVKVGVEAADEGFIVGTESGNDRGKAGFELLGVLGFQIVVEEDDGRKRESFCGEKLDTLLDVVVENAKLFFVEVGDQAAGGVLNGDRQEDVADIELKGGLAVGGVLSSGILLALLFCGGRDGIGRDFGNGCLRRVLPARKRWPRNK